MKQKQKRKNKNNLRKKYKFSLIIFNKILLVLVITTGIWFVATINNLSIQGFVIQNLKTKVTKFQDENNNLQLRIISLSSYKNVNKKAKNLKMVKVDKIDYFTIPKNTVARK